MQYFPALVTQPLNLSHVDSTVLRMCAKSFFHLFVTLSKPVLSELAFRRRRLSPPHLRPHSPDLRPQGPLRLPCRDVRDGEDDSESISGTTSIGRSHEHVRAAKTT